VSTKADSKSKWTDFATAGPWIAMAAAVILTAKGEFDLAVLAHFDESIAWMFPVMIDVYVVTAFHRRRWKDMVIGMFLMIFCQIAVHLLPVYITEGEATPWGLVVAVACIAPVVVVRVKMLTGRTAKEIEAEQEAAKRADDVRAARAETTAARQALAETKTAAAAAAEQAQAEIAAQAEQARTEIAAVEQRAQAEITARTTAETRAAEVETLASQAAAQAEIEAGKQAEILREARAEIGRLQTAVRDAIEARDEARRQAGEQTQAAGLAQGRLAEARESADRAAAAKVEAEQRASARLQEMSQVSEQAKRQMGQQLAAATDRAAAAERNVAELAERVRTVEAQRDEARAGAERAGNRAAFAEQQIAELERGRDATFDELERVRRQLARASERAEITVARQPEISGRPARKSAPSTAVALPENLAGTVPSVETVRPETVAAVLVARVRFPEATNAELAAATTISDRTIRKVLNAVPAEITAAFAGEVLALTGGVAA
jgi:myosin heavy subunit